MYAGFRNTLRLMRITQVFLRHDLGEFVTALGLYRGFRPVVPGRFLPTAD